MQLFVIALPFIIAFALVLVETVLPAQKYRWITLFSLILPVAGLAGSAVVAWLPGVVSDDGAFSFTGVGKLFLTVLFTLTSLCLITAYFTDNLRSGRYSPVALAVCGTINAALYINNVFIVTLCFVAAEFVSIIAVVDLDTQEEERFVRAIKGAVRYLIATVLFGLMLFIAQVFLERLRLDPQQTGLIKVIVALAIVGFALRLGVFPFNLWVPQVIEDAPALASWLVLGLINIAAVVFLIDFLQQNPTLLLNNYGEAQVVMAFAMSGAILAGVLALAQNGFGKMISYVASGNLSLILFGLATPHETGLRGALFDALNFALMQALIFSSLALVNYCNQGRALAGLTGLGRRMPVAAVGLSFGVLGLVGAPILSGFAGKYLILQSAAQEGLIWALLGGLAICFWLLAYLRYFHGLFMGRDVPGLKTRPEPIGAIGVILTLVVIIILVGLWPTPLLDLIGGALKGDF